MTMSGFFALFHEYGIWVICVVTFCEYMNLPGFPAGVVMPCIGVLIAQSELSLIGCIMLSIVFGVLGSLTIYALCYFGGEPIMKRLFARGKRAQRVIARSRAYIDAHNGCGLAICRLIPVLRTIVSIPAGLLRMPVHWFLLWSAAGIAVWNTVLISFGYYFSEMLLNTV